MRARSESAELKGPPAHEAVKRGLSITDASAGQEGRSIWRPRTCTLPAKFLLNRDIIYKHRPVQWAKDRFGFDYIDPWQEDVLNFREGYLALNCSRQRGKSMITAVKVVHMAMFGLRKLVLIVSPSERQSVELAMKVRALLECLPEIGKLNTDNKREIVLPNKSRIVSLPGNPATIRGYSAPDAIIIDEAAFASDQVYEACRPMLARSERPVMMILSTPFGQRGFFFEEWRSPTSRFSKLKITCYDTPMRADPAFLQAERDSRGELFFKSEYMCEFVSVDGSLIDVEMLRKCVDREGQLTFPGDVLRMPDGSRKVVGFDDEPPMLEREVW